MGVSCALLLAAVMFQADPNFPAQRLEWERVPDLPDREGFGGMFAGVSGGALIVAGGTNFPHGFPWEGGIKSWYDTIYLLDDPQGTWRVATETLPRPSGYGVSVTWQDSVVIAGGSDLKRHYADVFMLQLRQGKIERRALPPLPEPCANMCGSLVGSRLFIAGGTATPEATTAMRTFWSLDLSTPADKQRWEVLEPWPGLDRSHAVAASLDGRFYLISGFRWKAGDKGEPVRLSPFQTDVYRYTPHADTGGTWEKLPDVPRALGAAPSPAMVREPSQIFVIGGIDDSVVLPDPSKHPGFPRDVHVYDSVQNKWSVAAPMPVGASRVTAPSAVWHDRYLVINGERAPGRRSAEIYSVNLR